MFAFALGVVIGIPLGGLITFYAVSVLIKRGLLSWNDR